MIIQGGKAIRARTAFTPPMEEPWDVDAVGGTKGIAFKPDPCQDVVNILVLAEALAEILDPKGTESVGAANMSTQGQHVMFSEAATKKPMRSKFGIARGVLEQHGHI